MNDDEERVSRIEHLKAMGVNGAAAKRIVGLEDEVEDLKSKCSQLRFEFGLLADDLRRMQASAYKLVRVEMEDES
jgi:predicted RecB family endonuclease